MDDDSPQNSGSRRWSDHRPDKTRDVLLSCTPDGSDLNDIGATETTSQKRAQKQEHGQHQEQGLRHKSVLMLAAIATGIRRRRPVGLVIAIVFLFTFYLYTRTLDTMPRYRGQWQPAPSPEQATNRQSHSAPAPPAADAGAASLPEVLPEETEKHGASEEKPIAGIQQKVAKEPQRLLPMAYGTNARPPLRDIKTIIADLPPELLPQPLVDVSSQQSGTRARRLVIVGDVHGMKTSLQALLAKVNFDRRTGDHLILAGDMVNKGPDSAGVVELAMSLGASAVRGNHEDRVLLAHQAMKTRLVPGTQGDDGAAAFVLASSPSPSSESSSDPFAAAANSMFSSLMESVGGSSSSSVKARRIITDEENEYDDASSSPNGSSPGVDPLEQNPFSHGDHEDRGTVYALSRHQLRWLASLPVILRVGTIRDSPFTNVVVVHAGLVPGLALDRQDPWAVMNMRSLVYPGRPSRRERIRAELAEALRRSRGGRPAPPISEAAVDAEIARRRGKGSHPEDDARDDVAVPIKDRHGEPWPDAWARFQREQVPKDKSRTTVVYGHDAGRGLSVPKPKHTGPGATFGLDTGCVYGRQLTALVIEATADGVKHELVAVDCEDGRKFGGKKHRGGGGGGGGGRHGRKKGGDKGRHK